jgi:SAM-dependent methyltransferase
MMKIKASEILNWYTQPRGSLLLELEREFIAKLLANIFGDHLLQVGGLSKMRLTAASSIKHRLYLSLAPGQSDIQCTLEELPFRPASLDVIVVNHALEFCQNPAEVLNQLYISLVPNGQLILFGFNPWSLWGVCRFFKSKTIFPWCGRFHSISKIKHCLQKAGFSMVACRTLCFRPAIADGKWLKRLLFLDMLGQILCPKKGAVYAMIVQKQVLGTTPLQAVWSKEKVPVTPGIVEPAARNYYAE